ncbi:MAG: ABC transporter ATP-binding protein [Atopobium sp.]|uniref:ABC transporter ATP-binding protein n=1 Tax=Atopobium sp. TaxID=1872650 RepID=UPI002A838FB3|nr:ABC transporter ATP-binding protein [Atopobium sp.]MDY4522597.1 ABC transporter ATP-binding protein [Atopobium sp.]
MRRLLQQFLGPYTSKAILGVLTKMVEVVFEVLTPLVVARMIDYGVHAHDITAVSRLGFLLLLFAVVSYSFTLICQKCASLCSQGIGTDIRKALYEHISQFSSAEVDFFGSASLVTRITNDVNQVQLAVALGVRQVTRWPLLAIGSIIACLSIDVQLGLVVLVSTVLVGLIFYLVMHASIPFYKKMQDKLDSVSQITQEALSGVRVIRALRKDAYEFKRFSAASHEQAQVAISVGKLSSLLNPATFFVLYLAILVVLWIAQDLVLSATLTQGQVIAFVSYMTTTLISVGYLANLIIIFLRASASSMRIHEVLQTPLTVTSHTDTPIKLDANAPALTFENVSFSYTDAAQQSAAALQNLSFALQPGQSLGIIGGTGSGKSSVAQLLPRLYDATSGSIKLFGTDIQAYPLQQLHKLVGYVPQKPSLMRGTIRSNLLWRNPAATDTQLWDTLAVAQAKDFVEQMPGQLDSVVEAGGKNFSGGQCQRLTIARSLVDTPRLLVLDDAASALDYATDAQLRTALTELQEQVTRIIISQRVSAVMDASLILVLDHGCVAGLGTHDELMQTCTIYQEICLSQFSQEEVQQ